MSHLRGGFASGCLAILLALVAATCQGQVEATPTLRSPTIDDALAVIAIDAIAISPDSRLLAVVRGGEILILTTGEHPSELARFRGDDPVWSPNSGLLAFDHDVNGLRQISVWHRGSAQIESVTHLEDGFSPNPNYDLFGRSRLISWSPDSSRIAFASRVIGREWEGEKRANIRVLSADSSYMSVFEGVFSSDGYDYQQPLAGFEAATVEAISHHPELGLSKLFVVDIGHRSVAQLTRTDEYFFPAWSPDGHTIASVVDLSGGVAYPGPQATELSLIDTRTGAETRIATAWRFNGAPWWSPDGRRIVMGVRDMLIGFRRVEVYSVTAHNWAEVPMPGGRSVEEVRWSTGKGGALLASLADRFAQSLWRLDSVTAVGERVDTNGVVMHEFAHVWDQAANGDIVFSGAKATFKDRVFLRPAPPSAPLRTLYDSSAQLASLRFGEQRRLTWTNQAGDELDGIMILPPAYEPGHRFPVIVDVYPGPARDRMNLYAIPRLMGQIEASLGYVVFFPGLRAPHRASGFSRGQQYTEKARGAKGIPIMVDDFVSGVHYLEKLGIADPERIGIYGHSNGGYVANFLITETTIPRCAAISSGSSSDIYMNFVTPPGGWVQQITNGTIYDNLDEFVRMSPLLKMNKVRIPVLMLVGDHDWNTWLPEMLMEFNALREVDKNVTLVRYANEGHAFARPENVKDSLERIHRFFDENLKTVNH